MKKNLSMYIAAVTLFAVAAIPEGLSAQNNQQSGHQPHHYQLVDLRQHIWWAAKLFQSWERQ